MDKLSWGVGPDHKGGKSKELVEGKQGSQTGLPLNCVIDSLMLRRFFLQISLMDEMRIPMEERWGMGVEGQPQTAERVLAVQVWWQEGTMEQGRVLDETLT